MGRRPNGFHDLASLFQSISLSDQMHFSKLPASATKDEMSCSDTTLPVDDSNLVIKALHLMRSKTGIDQYFQVRLDKKVPMQAGLGGGSGNAATVMHAFNVLCKYPATIKELEQWSGDIGSDITFFFSSGTAYCTGRGELVTSLPPLPHSSNTVVHILKPKEGLSTGLVFKTLDLDKCLSGAHPEEILSEFQTRGALTAASSGFLLNDLQPPAFKLQPLLGSLCDELRAVGGAGAMMSGSGTSVYLLADELNDHHIVRENIYNLLENKS
eukprot:CAMPEP_0182430066 /NCGR_PEP_ID=MMETSP1167-20130531/36488_1 /TAXON_ID=2988 /ORGANISM="Mallomonas Sp, Strain CCMP3275" /LENGTH=268 /DNA_ID=CAMNT_0024614677 /DNA_START=290 /DNA_END=1092 /DNA_ORIENTATION=-